MANRKPDDPLAKLGKTTVMFDPHQPAETFWREVCRVLRKTDRFFCMDGSLVEITPKRGLQLISPQNFNASAFRYLEVRTETKDGLVYKLPPRTIIQPFVSSPEFIRKRFRPLDVYTTIPFVTPAFGIITRPGYGKKSRAYYDGVEIEPVEGDHHLQKMLSGFHWASEADLVNFVALLLCGLMAHLFRGRRPVGVVSGNKPGVGKSLLAKLCGILLDGQVQRTISYRKNDEEFEKQLATCVRSGARVVVVDNVRADGAEIRSAALERSITDEHLNFRLLGTSTAITKPNDLVFVLTVNRARLSPDLARRSLPINLSFDGDVRAHHYPIADLTDFAKGHRKEILGELVSIIKNFAMAGQPIPEEPAQHSVCQTWAATMDGMLRQSGWSGFLSNYDDAQLAYAPRYAVLLAVCEVFHDADEGTAADWAARISASPIVEQLGPGFSERTQRGQQTVIGSLFQEFKGAEFSLGADRYTMQVSSSSNSHQSKRYAFTRIASNDASTAGGSHDPTT